VRRKPGTLVPLEVSILCAAADLLAQDVRCFHGFQIARLLSGGTDERRLTAYGTLYRALGRLENLGMLESRWEDPQIAAGERRPLRRLYTLSPAGATAAAEAVPRPARGRRSPHRRKVAPA
jgi:PadR family transcriptional regulator, regulatory protein PadR